MHFFYIDEAGCTGNDLNNSEQPICTMGGVIIRDEAWNITADRYNKIVKDYYEGDVPDNFELHSEDLLSPNGDGHFESWSREKRNQFANDILDLCEERSHHFHVFAIEKKKLREYEKNEFTNRNYDCRTPYLISYDYLLSLINYYVKKRLGRSARGLIIFDVKDQFKNKIREISRFRKYYCTGEDEVKWIVEISYPIDSKENPMIQISDLVCFLTKKYYEIKNNYRHEYPQLAIDFYEAAYSKIHSRLIRKQVLNFELVRNREYHQFLKDIKA